MLVRTFPTEMEMVLVHPLQELRESYGLTIGEVAELSGIAKSTIEHIEADDWPYKTHRDVAAILAEALDCKVSDLFEKKELSHLGRPPLTGRPISRQTTTTMRISTGNATFEVTTTTTVEASLKCPRCNYELPLTGICDNHD